jgi:hypothetical protein
MRMIPIKMLQSFLQNRELFRMDLRNTGTHPSVLAAGYVSVMALIP